jgi:hypothetical protein
MEDNNHATQQRRNTPHELLEARSPEEDNNHATQQRLNATIARLLAMSEQDDAASNHSTPNLRSSLGSGKEMVAACADLREVGEVLTAVETGAEVGAGRAAGGGMGAAAVAGVGSGARCRKEARGLKGVLKTAVVGLICALASPLTFPLSVLYQTRCATLSVLSRIGQVIKSVFVETDPSEFERMLMRNIHQMDGTVNKMNASLTNAMNIVDKQVREIDSLQGLWREEHQKYQEAMDQKIAAETHFETTSRRFAQELAAVTHTAAQVNAAHTERLHVARAELHDRLQAQESKFLVDIQRLECALNSSQCQVGLLSRELDSARADVAKVAEESVVLAEELVAKASEEFHLKLADVQKAGLEGKGDIARLEMALNGSVGRMRLLENALEEAHEEGRKTKGEMACLERQVNDATNENSCQRALLQLRLATAEKGIEASEAALNQSRAECAKFVDRVRELETALTHHEAVFARKLQRGQAALNQSRREVAQLEERLEEAEATNS